MSDKQATNDSPQGQSLEPLLPGPLMIGLAGPELNAEEQQWLQHPWVGGVTLFRRNYQDYGQISALVTAIRQARKGPLLIAVDHEGGRVQRFHDGFTRLPPLAVYGRFYRDEPERALDYAYRHARVTAGELLSCGIDLAFAPVMDLDRGSDVIGDRAFASQAEVVTELSRAFIAGLHDGGMAAVGKHFPGHGSVREDSHHHVVRDARPWPELAQDLAPFRSLAEDLDAVMLAHVCYPAVDEAAAGFSRVWVEDVLRQQLAFQGVAISDDLGMAGAALAGDLLGRLQQALQAGCDIALICNADESRQLLAELNEAVPAPWSQRAQQALQRLAGRSRPDLAEYASVSEWRQWQRQLNELSQA